MTKTRILLGLAGLGLLMFTAAWSLYQHPSINWRVDMWRAEVRDFLFPRPETLPTPVATASAPPLLPTLFPIQAASPTAVSSLPTVSASPTLAPSPTPDLPPQVTLTGFEHQYQKFNFSLVFVIGWGGAFTLIGQVFAEYKTLLGQIGGLVVIVFGLSTLGVLKIPWLCYDTRPQWDVHKRPRRHLQLFPPASQPLV